MFKPRRYLKFYKQKSIDRIFGEIITDRNNSSYYKIYILDKPLFESDSYRHLLSLKLTKLIDDRKIIMYEDNDSVVEDNNVSLSLEISEDLCGLLDESFRQYEKNTGKRYGLYADKGVVHIHLR